MPTGLQDYRPALYGGIAALELDVDGIRRIPLDVDFRELERRIVLCYTGEPRNSGTNNWEITKRHIDGDRHVFDCFERIRDTAAAMRDRLMRGDWDGVGSADRRGMGQPQAARAWRDDARHRQSHRAGHGGRRDGGQGVRRGRRRMPLLLRSARPNATAIAEALAAGGARLLDYTIERDGLMRG